MTETEIEKLVVRLTGDNSDLVASLQDSIASVTSSANAIQQELDDIKKKFEEAATGPSTFSLAIMEAGSKISDFGNKISRVFGGVAKKGLMIAAAAETNKIAFETMTGSADQAENILKRLTKFAADTPFEMPEIVKAARGLILFGERGAKLESTLVTLGNAASATSSSFGEVAMIFNQVRGKGKLQMEEFYQFSERGILSMQDLADHYKVTTAEATAMISSGKVGFQDISEILTNLSGEGGRFSNMMEKQSKSLGGLLSTLSDSYSLLIRSIGEQFMPMAKEAVAWAIQWLDFLREMPSDLKKIAALLIGLTAASGTLLTMVGGLLVTSGALVASYTALTAAMGGATIASYALATASAALSAAPVIALSAAFIALGFAIYSGNSDIRKFNEEMKRTQEQTQQLSAIENKKTDSIFSQGAVMTEGDRKSFYEQQSRETDQLIAQQSKLLDQMKEKAEAAAPSILSLWQVGKKEYERLNSEINAFGESLANSRTRSERLKEALKEMESAKGPPVMDEKLVADAEKYRQSLNMQIVTFGKTGREAKILELEYLGLKGEQLDMIKIWDEELTKLEQTAKATKEKADATKKLSDDITNFNKHLETQVKTYGKSADEIKLYELAQRGASDASLKYAQDLINQKEALEESRKATEASKREMEKLQQEADALKDKFATPVEKFAKRFVEAKNLLDKGLIDKDTFKKEVEAAEKEILGKEFKADLKLTYTGIEGIEAGSADAAARIEEHRQRLQASKDVNKPSIASKIFKDLESIPKANEYRSQATDDAIPERLKKLVELGEKQLKLQKESTKLGIAGI